MEKTEIVPHQIRMISRASRKKIQYLTKKDVREKKLNWKDSLKSVLFLTSVIGISLIIFYFSLMIAGPFIAGLSGIGASVFSAYLIGILVEK